MGPAGPLHFSEWAGMLHSSGSRMQVLGCSGDLVNRLSNGPYRASYGGLRGILNGLMKSSDHPSKGILGVVQCLVAHILAKQPEIYFIKPNFIPTHSKAQISSQINLD